MMSVITHSAPSAGRRYEASSAKRVKDIAKSLPTPKTVVHGAARGQISSGVQAVKADKSGSAARPVSGRVISPSPRDRWQSSVTKLSPRATMAILWNALQGDLVAIEDLWETMQQTWPRLSKNLDQVRRAAASVKIKVTPFQGGDDDPTPTAIERAVFVKQCFGNWAPDPTADENGFEDCAYDMLDAIGKGVSLQETLWTIQDDGSIVPRATVWIHPRYYGYGPQGTRLQLRPNGPGGSWEDIPLDQFLVCSFKNKSGALLSRGVFRVLAWTWCAAMFGQDWLLNFSQVYGMPIRWATYDTAADPALIADLEGMMENLGNAGWGIFPAGTTLELKEASKSGPDTPQERLIERADKICDLMLLKQTLTSDATDRGTQALGTVHQDMYSEWILSVAVFWMNVISYQLIPTLLRLNFGDDSECPCLEPDMGVREDPAQAFKRDTIKILGGNPQTLAVLANLTDIKSLVREVGLPLNEDYEVPELKVPEAGSGDQPPMGGNQLPGNQPPMSGDPESDGDKSSNMKPNESDAGRIAANDATDQLVNNVLERITPVKVKWLGDVKPFFRRLAILAQSPGVTDADFVQALEAASRQLPELFAKMDVKTLETALENAMATSFVNGVAGGAMKRNGAVSRAKGKRDGAASRRRMEGVK